MRVARIASAIAIVWTAPAMACYNGPMPVQFAGNTARLTHDDLSSFEWQLDSRRLNFPNSRLLVIFYSPASKPLFDRRRRAIENYLLAKGLGPDDMSIEVARLNPPPSFLAEWTRGKVPTATVELARGGCH